MLRKQQATPIQAAGEKITELVGCLEQKEDNWCWAACIQMALLRRQVNRRQCAVVKTAFPLFLSQNGIDCCTDPAQCDRACNVPDVDDKFALNGVPATFVDGQLTLKRLREIVRDPQNPRLVVVGWKGSPRHVVLVVGVSATTDTIIVCDPDKSYLRTTMSFAELQRPVRPGLNREWRWSWTL